MSGASDDLVGAVVAIGGFVIHLLTGLRAITRPNRTPASRVAWIATIMCLPVIGVVAYLFLGETSIGRERGHRLRDAESRLATPSGSGAEPANPVANSVSDLCRSINGFGPSVQPTRRPGKLTFEKLRSSTVPPPASSETSRPVSLITRRPSVSR